MKNSILILNNKFTRISLLLIASIFLSSCASTTTVSNASEMYKSGMQGMDNKNYITAIQKFQDLGNSYPLSYYNRQAILELMFANMQLGNLDAVISASQRFELLYPNDEQLHYALYLRGKALFLIDKSALEDYIFTDIAQRDMGAAIDSVPVFLRLIKKFPNSPFAYDARQRVLFINNRLAETEMRAAQFYFVRERFIATINRCNNVLSNYIKTKQTLYALAVLEKTYKKLGMQEDAKKSRELLNKLDANFTLPKNYLD